MFACSLVLGGVSRSTVSAYCTACVGREQGEEMCNVYMMVSICLCEAFNGECISQSFVGGGGMRVRGRGEVKGGWREEGESPVKPRRVKSQSNPEGSNPSQTQKGQIPVKPRRVKSQSNPENETQANLLYGVRTHTGAGYGWHPPSPTATIFHCHTYCHTYVHARKCTAGTLPSPTATPTATPTRTHTGVQLAPRHLPLPHLRPHLLPHLCTHTQVYGWHPAISYCHGRYFQSEQRLARDTAMVPDPTGFWSPPNPMFAANDLRECGRIVSLLVWSDCLPACLVGHSASLLCRTNGLGTGVKCELTRQCELCHGGHSHNLILAAHRAPCHVPHSKHSTDGASQHRTESTSRHTARPKTSFFGGGGGNGAMIWQHFDMVEAAAPPPPPPLLGNRLPVATFEFGGLGLGLG
eukprot:352907-Chlamydomonas_euryale.AAC.3